MPMAPAPFYDSSAGTGFFGPPRGAAWWVETSDQVRLRVGLWPAKGEARGTVLIFPGRTEYIEKYGQTAQELTRRGFAVLVIDWRGQGLSDRLLPDRQIGHVARFTDFQKDIAAMLRVTRELDLPRPFHLLGHSMGGAIGLRAVMEGLMVQSCAFTGPMWGIYTPHILGPIAWATATIGPMLGLGAWLPPNTSLDHYVLKQAFDGNLLTHDPEMYAMMQDQLKAQADLGLGGPSLVWLREALNECKTLAARASPDMPCLTFLGTKEAIVDRDAVRARMQVWPRGEIDEVQGAHHEVLMERPEIRAHVFDRLEALFGGKPDTAAATG
ncbi:MAG: alpha/beta hydrolase [Rhodobacteraceae bacterium]|nr:alpha/beta hydrolase [Paracoccaceae bacterium]